MYRLYSTLYSLLEGKDCTVHCTVSVNVQTVQSPWMYRLYSLLECTDCTVHCKVSLNVQTVQYTVQSPWMYWLYSTLYSLLECTGCTVHCTVSLNLQTVQNTVQSPWIYGLYSTLYSLLECKDCTVHCTVPLNVSKVVYWPSPSRIKLRELFMEGLQQISYLFYFIFYWKLSLKPSLAWKVFFIKLKNFIPVVLTSSPINIWGKSVPRFSWVMIRQTNKQSNKQTTPKQSVLKRL